MIQENGKKRHRKKGIKTKKKNKQNLQREKTSIKKKTEERKGKERMD